MLFRSAFNSRFLDAHGVPHVEKGIRRRVAVVNVEDIFQSVALIRYNNSARRFKVTWRYADYDERMNGRDVGELRHL